jgi:UDP-N-acetylmuramoyl-tripeptide--D-alanyl-D-alanine ligase
MTNLLKALFHNWERHQAKKIIASHPEIVIVGVTGSYGKTNTSVAITTLLEEKHKVLMTDLNLDTIYNIPKTILKLKKQSHLVVELGVDHPNEMLTHLQLVKPTVGVITGIAPVHTDSEHLGSLEGVVREKGHLLEVLPETGWAIMNWDDKNVRDMVNKTKARVIRYGLNKDHCNLYATDIKVGFKGTTFTLHVQKLEELIDEKKVTIETPLIGRQHAYTILAAAGVSLTQGLGLEEIARGAKELQPLEGRVSIEKGPMGITLINDARRANLTSTLAGLAVLHDLPGDRKIAILGQMAEMGKYEEEGHREVGRKVAEIKPDYLVCVGPTTKFIVAEALKKLPEDRVFYCQDVFEATEKLKPLLKEGDLVYLKGSLLRHMERIILLLEGKSVDPDSVASKRYQVYK